MTPAKALPAVPESPRSTPSQEHARKASTDMALRRAREDMTPPGSEPIELMTRQPVYHGSPSPFVNGGTPPVLGRTRSNGSISKGSVGGSPQVTQGHYELSRLRRERQASISSQTSNSSSSSDKKRWWKINRKNSGSVSSPHVESPEDHRREREGTAETITAASPTPHPAKRSSTAETIRPSPRPAPIATAHDPPASPTVQQSIFETDEEMGRRR